MDPDHEAPPPVSEPTGCFLFIAIPVGLFLTWPWGPPVLLLAALPVWWLTRWRTSVPRVLVIASGVVVTAQIVDLTWPTSGYLVAALVATYLAAQAAKSTTVRALRALYLLQSVDPASVRWYHVKAVMAWALRDALASVATGLSLVCLAQAGLQVVATDLAEAATILQIEDWLTHACAVLRQTLWLSPATMATILLVLMLLGVAVPALQSVGHLARLRRWGSRALLVLMTATSFTFLTTVTVGRLEREWVAQRRDEARQEAAVVSTSRKELLSAALLEEHIPHLSRDSATELRMFFEAARSTSKPHGAVQVLARRLAERVEIDVQSTPSTKATAGAKTTNTYHDIEEWTGDRPLPITLEDLREWRTETARTRRATDEIKKAVLLQLNTLVGASLPDETLAKAFIDAFVHEIGVQRVKTVPDEIRSAAAARGWAQTGARPAPSWDLHIRDDVARKAAPADGEAAARKVAAQYAEEYAAEAAAALITPPPRAEAAAVAAAFSAGGLFGSSHWRPRSWASEKVTNFGRGWGGGGGGGGGGGRGGGRSGGGRFGIRRPNGRVVVHLT